MGRDRRKLDRVTSGMMSRASDPKIVVVVGEICLSSGSLSLRIEIEITLKLSRIHQLSDVCHRRFQMSNTIVFVKPLRGNASIAYK